MKNAVEALVICFEVAKVLLADERFKKVGAKTIGGGTALHVASAEGHPEAAKVLLADERLTEVNAKSGNGGTALHLAAARGCPGGTLPTSHCPGRGTT